MFQNFLRHWLRETLQETLQKKAAEIVSSAGEGKPSEGSAGRAGGCEPGSSGPTNSSGEDQAAQMARLPEPQKKTQQESEKTSSQCDVGVVFALESESGGLEDLLAESGRWSGQGFLVIAGRLQSRSVLVVRCGAGQSAAARATEALLDGHQPRWVISAGFAGALQPEIKRHELLLPEAVLKPSGKRLVLSCPESWSVPSEWGPGYRGTRLSVAHLVSSAKEKQALGETYGALAVEMETYGVVEVCQRRGVPVLAVRIIIDPVDEELPAEVRGLLKQKSAAARLGAAFGALWNRPSSLKDLYRLRENALLASDRLAKFLAQQIPLL